MTIQNLFHKTCKTIVILLAALLLIHLAGCSQGNKPQDLGYEAQRTAHFDSAAVVSAHPLASEAGLEILQRGGNAVDAAIATQFALAVVYPRAGNIGGGGFMVIRLADGQTAALDYRERAPAAAHKDMYLDSLGNVVPGLSTRGHLAVGVPGTVAGMWEAFTKFGQMERWADLLEPAIRLAEEGFRITPAEAERLNRYRDDFRELNTRPNIFTEKDEWHAGDLLVQPELAATLRAIQAQGPDGFYKGRVADFIVEEMQRGGGLITHEDLAAYEARWRQPVIGDYRGYRIISMPPPSSGGIVLLQMLEMVEPYPLSEMGFHSLPAVHLMVEAERRAYADRAKYLGDPDYYPVPADQLLDPDYLRQKMADFDPERATPSEALPEASLVPVLESFETTHTSVVDPQGNAVSVTTTLNSNYGCKVVVGGAGFFLNNEMDDFSAKPGVPNQFGLVGAEANAIAPGKRMLSSMTPTIVEKDGRLWCVLGAPGGSTIITAVFQVLLNQIEFGMTLDSAVQAYRFHHQFLPDVIMYERGAWDSTFVEKLHAMGHQTREVERMAVIKAITVQPDGTLEAAGDRRNPDDDVAGW